MECAASRTVLGIFREHGGRLRLERRAEQALPAPAAGEDRWLEHTQAALAALGGRIEAAGPVTLVLPPHLVLAKIVRIPRFERARREKVIRFAAEENIPCALSDVVWDHVAASEHELEVMLTAVKLEALVTLCAAVKAAGFKVRRVLPSSLATLAAFRLAPEVREPSLVLNLGARSATLLMVEGRRFVGRTLAIGSPGPVDDGGAARELLATRLAQEITRSILYFRREGGLADPARIQLTGGGAGLAGLGAALAARVKVPVERLDVSAAIEIGPGANDGETVAADPMLTDLVGAAATQLRAGHRVLNLLPPSLRQQENRRRHRPWLAGAALLGAAVLWPLVDQRRPAAEAGRAAVVIRSETPLPLAEALAVTPSGSPAEDVAPFDLELLDVKSEPFPLQLAGYFGGPGDYLVAFSSAGQPEILLARCGHRFEQLGLTLRSFEVRKVAVAHDDVWPVYEAVGFAVLQDELTGAEVVLDSRRKPLGTPQAVLRRSSDRQRHTLREGERFAHGGATYRLERIQADPPEVVVAWQAGELSLPETRVLQPVHPESGLVPNDP